MVMEYLSQFISQVDPVALLYQYAIAIAVFFGVYSGLFLFKQVLMHRFTPKRFGFQLLRAFVGKFGMLFYLVAALYSASLFVSLPAIVKRIILYVVLTVGIIYISRGFFAVVDAFIRRKLENKEDIENIGSLVNIIGVVVKVVFALIAVLVFLATFGVNVTSLVAGLGVGGIAIAFALQNVLEDIFSSLSIYLDKPFKEGDFVILGTDKGTIQSIGIKSTRIKALEGHELVVSNRELTTVRVNNYTPMDRRRIVFGFGVLYDTPKTKLNKIPKIVQKIIDGMEGATFDRAHFKEFGDFSLNFEVVYYVEKPEYVAYMDAQQEINLALVSAFKKEGIGFAYPTQTIFLKK
ncbi:MAG: mechanosensitive ion channel family protein [Candidatus Woesearchaeota archaeon]